MHVVGFAVGSKVGADVGSKVGAEVGQVEVKMTFTVVV